MSDQSQPSTIHATLQAAKTKLQKAMIPSASLDAELLMVDILDQDRSWLIAHGADQLNSTQQKKYSKHIAARARRQPVAYVVGHKEFYGLKLLTTPDALIPRPETELIVEQILSTARQRATVLDIGTGCGAIAIALAHTRADLQVSASDISEAALGLARKNATMLMPHTRIKFFQSDLLNNAKGRFDVIAANLPYVPTEKRARISAEAKTEPQIALYGGDDGLDIYRHFFANVSEHLKPHGTIYCESDPWQHKDLQNLALKAGFKRLFEDYLICGFIKA